MPHHTGLTRLSDERIRLAAMDGSAAMRLEDALEILSGRADRLVADTQTSLERETDPKRMPDGFDINRRAHHVRQIVDALQAAVDGQVDPETVPHLEDVPKKRRGRFVRRFLRDKLTEEAVSWATGYLQRDEADPAVVAAAQAVADLLHVRPSTGSITSGVLEDRVRSQTGIFGQLNPVDPVIAFHLRAQAEALHDECLCIRHAASTPEISRQAQLAAYCLEPFLGIAPQKLGDFSAYLQHVAYAVNFVARHHVHDDVIGTVGEMRNTLHLEDYEALPPTEIGRMGQVYRYLKPCKEAESLTPLLAADAQKITSQPALREAVRHVNLELEDGMRSITATTAELREIVVALDVMAKLSSLHPGVIENKPNTIPRKEEIAYALDTARKYCGGKNLDGSCNVIESELEIAPAHHRDLKDLRLMTRRVESQRAARKVSAWTSVAAE